MGMNGPRGLTLRSQLWGASGASRVVRFCVSVLRVLAASGLLACSSRFAFFFVHELCQWVNEAGEGGGTKPGLSQHFQGVKGFKIKQDLKGIYGVGGCQLRSLTRT